MVLEPRTVENYTHDDADARREPQLFSMATHKTSQEHVVLDTKQWKSKGRAESRKARQLRRGKEINRLAE